MTNKIDLVILFVEGTTLLLPMIMAKVLGKKTIVVATGSGKKGADKQFKDTFWGHGGRLFSGIIALIENINRKLANRIVVESPSLISWLALESYQNKVFPQGALFVDITNFSPVIRIQERKNVITYIGRLSAEKGSINFVKSIPYIIKQRSDIEFLICGDGILLPDIKKELQDYGSNIRILGWISHDQMPLFLNETKLLVVPSFTEGLPNIVLEAMACGTLVMATAVGGIPDVIHDKLTGFVLENNSPECIASRVIKVLDYSNPELITNNARQLIESKFTFQAAVERYQTILKW